MITLFNQSEEPLTFLIEDYREVIDVEVDDERELVQITLPFMLDNYGVKYLIRYSDFNDLVSDVQYLQNKEREK